MLIRRTSVTLKLTAGVRGRLARLRRVTVRLAATFVGLGGHQLTAATTFIARR